MTRSIAVLFVVAAAPVFAQSPAKIPDTVIFTSGEQLSGELMTATSDGITFKSPMAGELRVKWANVRELRSDKNFAILTANQKVTRKTAAAIIPQGRISVAGKTITVATSAGPRTLPLGNAARIVDAAAFDRAVNHPPAFYQGWIGTATGGVSLVRATQNSTTFSGAINLTRATPRVDWLPARDRTTLDYNQAYGTVSQPNTPTLKTNIFHAAAERDEYFAPRLFTFASAAYDHNFSQSLDLQQAYGGGVGITFLRSTHQQLDFKGDVHYEKQVFLDQSKNVNLFGSTFSEKYLRLLHKGLVFHEFGSISPSWNNLNAYASHVNANLGFPVFKGLGFNLGAVDDYLNNAPAGFKRNSSQFTTGIIYTIGPR